MSLNETQEAERTAYTRGRGAQIVDVRMNENHVGLYTIQGLVRLICI
jgi:hypothetical protein